MSNLISPQTTALADVNAGAAELSSLAVFGGGKPAFSEPLHIGRPNLGNREVMLRRVNEIFDRRWFTNDGPLGQAKLHKRSRAGPELVVAAIQGQSRVTLVSGIVQQSRIAQNVGQSEVGHRAGRAAF